MELSYIEALDEAKAKQEIADTKRKQLDEADIVAMEAAELPATMKEEYEFQVGVFSELTVKGEVNPLACAILINACSVYNGLDVDVNISGMIAALQEAQQEEAA